MNIERLLILVSFITVMSFILMLFFDLNTSIIMPIIFILFFTFVIFLPLPEKLDSELIIEEYLRSSYSSEINREDISDILNVHDKNAELLHIKTYKIPNSTSLFVKLDVRIGKHVYRDLEYTYTIGVNDNKVFVKKGD